ncbi:MAG: OsmC-related (seleno)protein [Nitrososphaerales archaeon]
MKTIPELREVVTKREERRLTLGRDIGTKRVDIKNVEQLRHEVSAHGFSLIVDEPAERGGTHLGLDPLGYFVTGAASCFLNQFARSIMIRDLKVDDLEMTARAHYDMAKTRDFTDFIYDVHLSGKESKENVLELLYEAERRCFVHQTLKKAIPLTTNVFLNGVQVVSHTLGPGQ